MKSHWAIICGVILLLAGATVGYLLSPKKDRLTEDLLESEKIQLQHKVQLLDRDKKFYREMTYEMMEKYHYSKDSLKQARESTAKWRKKYEQSQKTRLPANTTDAQLDSIFTNIIRR